MYRIPPGAGRPRPAIPTHEDTLREFARPVAALARPEPGWTILLGREGIDGYLTDIDLDYAHQRAYRVRVRTVRPAPEYFRVKPRTRLEDVLDTTVSNFRDEDGLDPLASAETLLNPAPAASGEAVLRLDGQEHAVRTAARDGFFAAVLEVGDQSIVVAAPETLRDVALDLTWIQPGQSL
ncbi:hypothetical protein ACFVXG_30695 [Kitasatospora sp. NPDC058162]|uniref:hypothetical protein n=1 Tax=Kitasatospora sp. NPDC058162 TaxID=3346362 RepID=UPI0036DF34D6